MDSSLSSTDIATLIIYLIILGGGFVFGVFSLLRLLIKGSRSKDKQQAKTVVSKAGMSVFSLLTVCFIGIIVCDFIGGVSLPVMNYKSIIICLLSGIGILYCGRYTTSDYQRIGYYSLGVSFLLLALANYIPDIRFFIGLRIGQFLFLVFALVCSLASIKYDKENNPQPKDVPGEGNGAV